MQNHQVYSINHVNRNEATRNSSESYSRYEPAKKVKTIKCSAIALLIVALILGVVLMISIALVFTIGLRAAQQLTSPEPSASATSSLNALYEPCACGCPLIEPVFADKRDDAARVVNGETVRPHSWPWQMLLINFNRNVSPASYCGATLITDRHILTAAHCLHRQFPPFVMVFPSQHTLNLSIALSSGYSVTKIFIHEGYSAYLHHDIAIVAIDKPLRFDSHLYPICLASLKSPVLRNREELVATGWGLLSGNPDYGKPPSDLQQVKLGYVPSSHPNCSDIFKDGLGVHPGQMCAGKPGYNICQGDSGGPLVRRIRVPNTESYYWQQVGIVSATVGCGWNSTYPDVFVNILYYYDWIVSTIKRAT